MQSSDLNRSTLRIVVQVEVSALVTFENAVKWLLLSFICTMILTLLSQTFPCSYSGGQIKLHFCAETTKAGKLLKFMAFMVSIH